VPCSASRVVPGAHRVVGPGIHRGSGPREVHTTDTPRVAAEFQQSLKISLKVETKVIVLQHSITNNILHTLMLLGVEN
jgi:hypothetical protein